MDAMSRHYEDQGPAGSKPGCDAPLPIKNGEPAGKADLDGGDRLAPQGGIAAIIRTVGEPRRQTFDSRQGWWAAWIAHDQGSFSDHSNDNIDSLW